MFESYFQQGTKTVGGSIKEIWHFAIAGTTNKGNLIELTKATINSTQWQTMLNTNYFPGINHYYAGWLSGADPKVLQHSDVGSSTLQSLEKSN
jgi:hypothetical protein